ncbi:M48 family metallopeptidase [Kibdelosporangium philippinense]|uniref:M48 family metallopeptidase n=1 Tax=Kibdelosporangium philippinense TaxID=211113 RepID=A0ABS8ZZF6_9PSEU|nr:YgjP-like metallopeptidase domain-containing protein [Kibdelosporangium philippinense]MCE7011697.1 M48 family metallopeptidase [Kibdelosporangium philippinense]
MSSHDIYAAAVAGLQLPAEWQVTVALRPRRRTLGMEVAPGGTVTVLIPSQADPDQVIRFVSGHRTWITEKVATAVRLAPDHPVKEFVDGETFDLFGQRYRLRFVDTLPAGVEQLPAVTAERVLYVRRQRPERVRRAIIGLYRQEGLAWARREGRQYELGGRIEHLSYAVRDLGRHRWGTYEGLPKHTTTLHWAVFGLPMPLVEYVLAHEQAHATRPPGRAHGPAWQRRIDSWMPDWRQRKTELAEAGRHAWLGEWKPRS